MTMRGARIETMYKIEDRAKKLLGDEAYNDYLRLVEAICQKWTVENPTGFDVVVLIDRKGSDIFRCFMRILKETEKINLDNLPVILSSRNCGSYNFGVQGDGVSPKRVLIFDDIINKGRNLEQFACNLHRRGVRNINFCAFAYRHKLLMVGDYSNSIVIEPNCDNKPTVKFIYNDEFREEEDRGYFNRKDSEHIRLDIFYKPHSKDDYLLKSSGGTKVYVNRNYFLSSDEARRLSHTFNRIIHYSATPYTAYMSYCRFDYKLSDKIALESLSISGYENMPLRIVACEKEDVGASIYYKQGDYNYKNGYFSGIRVLVSPIGQILFHSTLTLPSFTPENIGNLYNKLGLNNFSLDGNNLLLFDKLKDVGFDDEGTREDGVKEVDHHYLITHLKRKTQLESAKRRLIAVLSAVNVVEFIKESTELRELLLVVCEDEKKALTDNDVINEVAKSLKRYFLADFLANGEEKRILCQNEMNEFLKKACKIVKDTENVALFNFFDYPSNPQGDDEHGTTELLEMYTSIQYETRKCNEYKEKLGSRLGEYNKNCAEYRRTELQINDATRFLNHMEELLVIESSGKVIKKYNFIDRILSDSDVEMNFDRFLWDIVRKLADIDKEMLGRKLFPLPLIGIVHKIIEAVVPKNVYDYEQQCQRKFIEAMSVIEASVEEGIISTCSYAEQRHETEEGQDKFLVSTYVQRGELWALKFVVNLALQLSNVSKKDDLFSKFSIDSVQQLILEAETALKLYSGEDDKETLFEQFGRCLAIELTGTESANEILLNSFKEIKENKIQTNYGWDEDSQRVVSGENLATLFTDFLIDKNVYNKEINSEGFLGYVNSQIRH